MKVESEALKSAFDLVDLIPVNSVLLTSQFVELAAQKNILRLKLAGIAAAEAKCPCDGEIQLHVDRRALGSFLARATGKITCEQGKAGILLRSHGNRLTVSDNKETGAYPEIKPSGRKVPLDPSTFAMLSAYCKSATEPYFEVVCCHKGLGAFATDSLTVAAVLEKAGGEEVLIPRFISGMLSKTTAKEIWVSGQGTTLIAEHGWLHQPLPVGDKPYPTDRIRDTLNKCQAQAPLLSLKAEDLLSALSHLNTFSWAVQGTQIVYCRLDPAAKQMQLKLDAQVLAAECFVDAKFNAKAKPPEKLSLISERVFPWLEYVKAFGIEVFLGTMGTLTWMRCKEERAAYMLVMAGMD